MIGQRVGQYEILDKIGEGGMGAVYSALDTSLDRKVALKVLPEAMAADPSRFERFQREAKAVAALNHPNIVTIHSVEEVDGLHFLTMELVEGRRLDTVIPAGGLGLEQIFELAIPLAEAVTAAHDKGIIHRDLKPANVMVTPDGRVKVLDFGLAKLSEPDTGADATHLPTEAITAEGKVMGTVPYMSPEQVQGRPVDHRSDIFSLGILLYEMCVGVRPFQGDTSADLISSILRDQPSSVTDVKGTLPRHMGRIIRHCLEKDPGERFQTARDVRNELRGLRREVASGELELGPSAAAPAAPTSGGAGTYVVVGVGVAILAGVLWFWGPRPTSTDGVTESSGGVSASEAAPAERQMIVVLPFENLGPAEDEYFADGISEEITSRLAALDGLATISRASARRYKGNRPSTAELGEALGVDFILEGTVRWEHVDDGPSRVRVTPELIRVADDTSLWSSRYDEQLDQIFAVQSSIAEEVASALDIALLAGDREKIEARPTDNMEAYQAFLRARELWNEPGFDAERFELNAEMFERAATLDPTFLEPVAEVASVYGMLHTLTRDPIWVEKAKSAVDRARAIDADHPLTYWAAGHYEQYGTEDYDAALGFYEQAAEERPNDAEILQSLAFLQRRRGELDSAEAYMRQAIEVDPQSANLIWELGRILLAQRQFEEAYPYLDRAVVMTPDEEQWWEYRAWSRFLENGDTSRARAILAEMPGLWEGNGNLIDLDLVDRAWQSALDRLDLVTDESPAPDWFRSRAPLLRGIALRGLDREREAREAFAEGLENARYRAEEIGRVRWYFSMLEAAAHLGDEATARATRATIVDVMPDTAFWSPSGDEDYARALATLGHQDEAIDILERLLATEYDWPITRAVLQTDPAWDPLRGNERFERLIQ